MEFLLITWISAIISDSFTFKSISVMQLAGGLGEPVGPEFGVSVNPISTANPLHLVLWR